MRFVVNVALLCLLLGTAALKFNIKVDRQFDWHYQLLPSADTRTFLIHFINVVFCNKNVAIELLRIALRQGVGSELYGNGNDALCCQHDESACKELYE